MAPSERRCWSTPDTVLESKSTSSGGPPPPGVVKRPPPAPFSGTLPEIWRAPSVSPPATVEVGHLASLGLRKAELGHGHEVGLAEVLARLAEVVQAHARRAVLLAKLLLLLLAEIRERTARAAAAVACVLVDVERAGNREIGAHAGKRPQHLVLCLIEAIRERGDRDHQPHSHAETERGQEGAPLPAAQLRGQITQVEHGVSSRSVGLRPANQRRIRATEAARKKWRRKRS